MDHLIKIGQKKIKGPLDGLYDACVFSASCFGEPDQMPRIAGCAIQHALVQLQSKHPARIHVLHPSPPISTKNDAPTEREAELIVVAKNNAHSKKPVIVTGDLIDVAWSETTRLSRKISELLDPRLRRGLFNRFHADYWFMRWALDHLFHSNHFRLSKIRWLLRFGSDHFALFTELSYESEHETESNGLEADRVNRR